ncbi:MAG: hypothetical protein HKN09_12275 [Saprospiraceae bacterium]|nr:hypothetical protein [Saprospiraceae bacterium]
MNWTIKTIFFFLIFTSAAHAQVFLQLEKYNDPNTIKIQAGEYLSYTLKEYPDVWRKAQIQRIDYEGNLIVFDEGFRTIDEFEKIRLYRGWAKAVGYGLMQFSAGWYLFGGIATLTQSDYTMSEREIIIGGIFAGVGFLVKQLFYKRTIKLGKRNRLRIVDIRMFDPSYQAELRSSNN